MKTLGKLFGAAAIIVFSFVYALAAMEFADYWRAQNLSSFKRASADAGLAFTESIAGHIDNIRRDYDKRLVLTGWAYDKRLGQPLSIFVFMNGKLEQIIGTKGARADVAAALGLPPEKTKDAGFSWHTEQIIDCMASGELTVVAVNPKKQFAVLGRDLLTPGCRS